MARILEQEQRLEGPAVVSYKDLKVLQGGKEGGYTSWEIDPAYVKQFHLDLAKLDGYFAKHPETLKKFTDGYNSDSFRNKEIAWFTGEVASRTGCTFTGVLRVLLTEATRDEETYSHVMHNLLDRQGFYGGEPVDGITMYGVFNIDEYHNWDRLLSRKFNLIGTFGTEQKQDLSINAVSHETANNNRKEQNMSDEFEEAAEAAENRAVDPKEAAFLSALHQRKVVAEALKAGTLSCLPGADGYADTKPAVNLVNGTFYHGANMLFLKEHQKQNGFPTAEYLSGEQLDRARQDDPSLSIRKGQKGVSLHVSQQNEETGEYEDKHIRLFNVAQTTKPGELKAWAEEKQQEKLEEKLAYLQSQYGSSYQLPEAKQKGPGPEIACTSTEPEKYLGQYLAAVSLGGKFKVSNEQAAEFNKKFEGALFEKMENGHSNPFKLQKISNAASGECKEVIKELHKEQRQERQQEQSRGGRGL